MFEEGCGLRVRKGNISDFSKLKWAWTKDFPTLEVFKDRIANGKQELWVVDLEDFQGRLVGEFHIVWDSPDPDEADEKNRAYLCAFRIHPDYRGQGYGKALLEGVLDRVREQGIREVTIGVKENRPDIRELYYKWGFDELIKTKKDDHHNFNINGEPNTTEVPIELYLKEFG